MMKTNQGNFGSPQRLMTGPYLARNPLVVGAMAAGDLTGMLLPRRAAPLAVGRSLNIVVANLAHLGDLIVLLPLLTTLRAWKRTGKLGLLIGSWGRSVLDLGNFVDEIHIVDHWRFNRAGEGYRDKLRRHFRTRATALAEMRSKGYDASIDSYAYLGNSADLLWSAGVPMRTGFTSGGGSTLYTHRVPFDPQVSMYDNQSRLLEPLLGNSGTMETSLSLADAFFIDAEADRLARGLGEFVVLHIGPGSRHKDWPSEQWVELGRLLLCRGLRLVFTGAPSEAAHGEPVRAVLGGEDLIGKLSLRGLSSLLRHARGLVAIDTMIGHLAAPFHVPTVVVYPGITPSNFWRPSHPFARPVTHAVACAPCNRTDGCEAMMCIRALQARTVFAVLDDLMKAKAATKLDKAAR